MNSYLQRIAGVFAGQAGNRLPDYTFVFPNHRAGLFFRKYLAQALPRPAFAPEIGTINECFADLSDLHTADQLTLLVRLYDLYRNLRPDAEAFEQFLYWGRMMLSDFSETDNHLVPNVQALFSAVRDLHDIDERFAYLTDNQREAIRHFWGEFIASEQHHPDDSMHPRFMRTWELLYPLYDALRKNLLADGLAYDGLLHREVIEHFDTLPAQRLKAQYVFVGFNALTESERQLMLRLQDMGRADFYFDYENGRLRDPQNRASLFMEDNQRLFRSRYTLPEPEDNRQPECHLIAVSSTVGEAHEVYHILHDLYAGAGQPDYTRTAVVLPDEQLLIPLLDCFPPEVKRINVTMGYPLRATALYMPVAYPEQFFDPMPATPADMLMRLRTLLSKQRTEENSEGTYQLLQVIDKTEAVMANYPQVPFSVEAVLQVLRMLTLEATIPYAGEPLDGLQVMGVLETRALDFDNLVITGFNDDLYPGRTHNSSFIPYILRRGFGLPTPERQDAIFAYNFYRMLSYARRVWFITNATADEQHSGEVSRYFYQLQWQYNLPIDRQTVVSPLYSPAQKRQDIEKTDAMLHSLSDYAKRGISPSALNMYLRCPKQFYYRHVLGIHEPPQDEDVVVSDATLGSVFHAIACQLYRPYEGKMLTDAGIRLLQEQADALFRDGNSPCLKDLHGDVLAEQVVRCYVNNLLQFDSTQVPVRYIASEQTYRRTLTVPEAGDVVFYGIIDRIDEQGGQTRIVDYKTGKAETEFKDMNQVFDRKNNQAKALQILLYCWLHKGGAPHLYPVRRLSADDDIRTLVHPKGSPDSFSFCDVEQEFTDALRALVQEIFDPAQPFRAVPKHDTCERCAFRQLCR